MPERYDAIKTKLMQQGYSEQAAKTAAAKIYQSTRKPGEPELNHYVAQERRKAEGK